ncbi:MAG TPA: metallophosphoesterase [Blastocatellia bacterium]
MIRIAAIADVHFSETTRNSLRDYWNKLHECADLLLIGGDLTTHGGPDQAAVLAAELEHVQVPIVAVLGNHDYHSDQPESVRKELEAVGVTVLEQDRTTLEIDGHSVGIAGTCGFGGGFAGACGSDFGEPQMKAFIRYTQSLARALETSLKEMNTDFRIALLHYSPIKETVAGERLEIYPFLGSYLLAQAIDRAGADLAIHGHAHHGQEKGVTPGGVPVRNVALPVLRRPYAIYTLEKTATPKAAANCP